MPAKPKHTNFMRATIWTPSMRIDSEGSPAAVVETAFHALVNRPRRRAVLMDALRALDAEFTKVEAEHPENIIEKKV